MSSQMASEKQTFQEVKRPSKDAKTTLNEQQEINKGAFCTHRPKFDEILDDCSTNDYTVQ